VATGRVGSGIGLGGRVGGVAEVLVSVWRGRASRARVAGKRLGRRSTCLPDRTCLQSGEPVPGQAQAKNQSGLRRTYATEIVPRLPCRWDVIHALRISAVSM